MGGLILGKYQLFSAEALASTAVLYSRSIRLTSADAFGINIQVTSVLGTPNAKVELEMSDVPPTTEGAADSNFVVPDGVSDIYSALNVETVKIKQITPVPQEYMRIKVTGNGGASPNPADTLVTISLAVQELL